MAIANRMLATIPKAKKEANQLNLVDCVIGAQIALSRGLNPLADIHLWKDDDGTLNWTEHYTVYVRWAERKEPYQERYTKLDGLPEGAIGYRCYILRQSGQWMFQTILNAALANQKNVDDAVDMAWENAAKSAIGLINKAEQNAARFPPRGWTWDQVARKRALRNAIREAYGTPGPDEIAVSGNWEVDATPVTAEDIAQIPDFIPPEQAEEYAKLVANNRQWADDMATRRETMTPEEIFSEKKQREETLRGKDEGAIGEEPTVEEGFWYPDYSEPVKPEPAKEGVATIGTVSMAGPAHSGTYRQWHERSCAGRATQDHGRVWLFRQKQGRRGRPDTHGQGHFWRQGIDD